MRYDYDCKGKCKSIIEIEKKMIDPAPVKCPVCGSKKFTRIYSVPNLLYPGRPIHTYNDTKKYKTFRQNGGPLKKVDLSKHGDLGSWHTDADVAPEPKKKGKKK